MPHKNRVRIYRQNQTMETCLCCCILMILDYYYRLPGGRSYPTRQMEDQLYGFAIPFGEHRITLQRFSLIFWKNINTGYSLGRRK